MIDFDLADVAVSTATGYPDIGDIESINPQQVHPMPGSRLDSPSGSSRVLGRRPDGTLAGLVPDVRYRGV
ncbi:hypothetical protein [Micromonospora cremea]|uniref:hypothetical protein n=1 Tax=Micromonospora cremea TaxID=709881 RepID=UPI00117E736F|nr:hypothetical protein [Micromonospora cremea]